MSTPLHHHWDPRSAVPELLDWLESPFMTLRPYLAQPIRLEDHVAEGRYVVRAELAGFDPEKDIEVTVGPGFLTIKAERADESEGRHHSEFRYGRFTRTVALPADADDNDVTAACHNGILTVSIGLKNAEKEPHRKVSVTKGAPAPAPAPAPATS
jgi:HSP20 family protein